MSMYATYSDALNRMSDAEKILEKAAETLESAEESYFSWEIRRILHNLSNLSEAMAKEALEDAI